MIKVFYLIVLLATVHDRELVQFGPFGTLEQCEKVKEQAFLEFTGGSKERMGYGYALGGIDFRDIDALFCIEGVK